MGSTPNNVFINTSSFLFALCKRGTHWPPGVTLEFQSFSEPITCFYRDSFCMSSFLRKRNWISCCKACFLFFCLLTKSKSTNSICPQFCLFHILLFLATTARALQVKERALVEQALGEHLQSRCSSLVELSVFLACRSHQNRGCELTRSPLKT